MLTKEAFNALLKTLEEPPAHVVFILATTEEEKLLDTILSRCLVFRFNSPSQKILNQTVTDIAKQEGFTLASEAADLVAIAADGSFRDALGITQKVIMAAVDKTVEADEVARIIGAPKQSLIGELLLAFQEKDSQKGLAAIAEVVASHADFKLFYRLFLEQVRVVMLLRNQPSLAEELLQPYSSATRKTLQDLAKSSSTALNSHLLLKLLQAFDQMSRSPLPHLSLEIILIEHCEK